MSDWFDWKFAASLPFEGVQFWIERSLHNHRYLITMQHRPLVRTMRVPAHRVLWFAWGNVIADRPMRVTGLGFSRRGIAAATALRAQLVARGLPPFRPAGWKG